MSIFAVAKGSAAVALPPGQPFVTYRVRATAEDAATLGVAAGDYADMIVSHPPNALDAFGSEDLARYGIQTVAVAVPPAGQREAGRTLSVSGDGTITCAVTFEAIPPPPVPPVVTRVQGRLQLIAEGKLATVDAAVAQAGAVTQEYWASTGIFRRDNATLAAMWAQLGWSTAALDATFRAAAAIET